MSEPAVQPVPIESPAATATTAAPVAAPTDGEGRNTGLFNRRTLNLLTRGPFGRYVVGDSISMVGIWMQIMAQNWVMTDLTKSAFWLGMVNFSSGIPMLALAMYGGTVADRHDKRRIIIACQVVQMILAAVIGWLVLTGQIQIWHILAAACLLGISGAFEMPATSALVPELVDKDQISTAIAVDRSIFHATRLIGPAVGGYLIAVLGRASAFFANSLSFIASITAILSIAPRPRGTDEEEEQRNTGMKAGIAYVRQDKPTMAMIALMASNTLWIFPFLAVMMALYAREVVHLDSLYTGYLMGMSGIGAVISSACIPLVPRPTRLPWMIAATSVIAIAMCGLALARNFPQAAVSLVALGVGTAFNYGLANTIVQERAPGPMRGRVSALAMLSFVGVMPFTSVAVSAFTDRVGISTGMFCAAAGYAVSSLLIFAGPARRMNDLPPGMTAAVPVSA